MPQRTGLLMMLLICAGCTSRPPLNNELAPLQQRQAYSRDVAHECDASYNDVWWGALSDR